MDEHVTLSEEQQTAVGRSMVQAALDELMGVGPFEDTPLAEISIRVVRAAAAVKRVEREERGRLARAAGAKYAYIDFEPSHTLATAFWVWLSGGELSVDDVHPNSVAGGAIMALVRGMNAVSAMDEACRMLASDVDWAFDIGEADTLLKTVNK